MKIAISLMLAQDLIYALMDCASKVALKSMNVYTFLSIRYFIASCAFLIIWNKEIIEDIKSVNVKHYLLPGLFPALMSITTNLALVYTLATNVSFLRSLGSVIIPLVSFILLKTKVKIKDIGIIILSTFGLYLLCMRGGKLSFGIGEVIALISALLVALGIIYSKDARKYVHASTLSFTTIFCGFIIVFVIGLLNGSIIETDWSLAFTPLNFALWGYAALISSILGTMAPNIAITHASARIVGLSQCMYPVFASICAHFILNEQIPIIGYIGGIVLVISLILSTLSKE